MPTIKQKLYEHCRQNVELLIQNAKRGIDSADEAVKSETKGSAGDKHETGRAMIHLEKEQNIRRLNEALANERALKNIDPTKINKDVVDGAIVHTSFGNYFIAISAGKIEVEDKEYLTISLSSPLGEEIEGSEAGDIVSFRGKDLKIISVF